MGKLLFSSLLACTVWACGKETATRSAPGVYYWQAGYELEEAGVMEMRATGFTDLYLRLFDVDWDGADGEPYPRGTIRLPAGPLGLDSLRVTPVVYLVNDLFRESVNATDLATKLMTGIDRLTQGHPELLVARRLQLDCDWTPVTKDRYFQFLREVKRLRPDIHLSVTVRLHQYRDRETNGLPPADRGLLMCYNMVPVQQRATTNAIFDLDLLSGYLGGKEAYPLPLDAALPVFAWGAAFRDDRFLGIVESPVADPRMRPFAEGRFLVQRDTTVEGLLLRAGDEVRADGPGSYENLRAAVRQLRDGGDIENLLFYDWRPDRMAEYRVADLLTEFYD